jgi:hypothetical protein
MTVLLIGIGLFACLVGLFWIKGVTRRAWLARLAYSEFIARLAIIAMALMMVGLIATIGDLFN